MLLQIDPKAGIEYLGFLYYTKTSVFVSKILSRSLEQYILVVLVIGKGRHVTTLSIKGLL